MDPLRLVIPKGRIGEGVRALLDEVGYGLAGAERSYRPRCDAEGVEVKLLKPQNIPQLLALGRHDLGFSGHDWVIEQGAEVIELLDLGLDPVRIVAAAPESLAGTLDALGRPVIVATEYVRLAERFLAERGLRGVVVRTYGATEVFPPEDADLIVDNTSTGQTLRSNGLAIVATLLESSTRLIASPEALADPGKRARIEDLASLISGVLLARRKVLLEMNVPADRLEALVRTLPAMRSPTVSPLFGEQGFAVKVAVDRALVPGLLPSLRRLGATDILEYRLTKIVPG